MQLAVRSLKVLINFGNRKSIRGRIADLQGL